MEKIFKLKTGLRPLYYIVIQHLWWEFNETQAPARSPSRTNIDVISKRPEVILLYQKSFSIVKFYKKESPPSENESKHLEDFL